MQFYVCSEFVGSLFTQLLPEEIIDVSKYIKRGTLEEEKKKEAEDKWVTHNLMWSKSTPFQHPPHLRVIQLAGFRSLLSCRERFQSGPTDGQTK